MSVHNRDKTETTMTMDNSAKRIKLDNSIGKGQSTPTLLDVPCYEELPLTNAFQDVNKKKEILQYAKEVTSVIILGGEHIKSKLEKLQNPHPITYVYKGEDTVMFEHEATTSMISHIIIDPSVTSLPDHIFDKWYSVKSITFQESSLLTNIGEEAFKLCVSLTKIVVPPSVVTIGKGAFAECLSLTQIDLPPNLSPIETETFYHCISLTTISLPSSQEIIHPLTFNECSSLVAVDIPPSVSLIDTCAFYRCSSLISICIPPSVTSIGYQAFGDCFSLRVIHLPPNVNITETPWFQGTKIILVDDERTYDGEPTLRKKSFETCLNHVGSGLETSTVEEQLRVLNNAFQECYESASQVASLHGMNLLHLLVQYPNTSYVLEEIGSLLEKCPAVVRSTDIYGNTPLFYLQLNTKEDNLLRTAIQSSSPSWKAIEMIALSDVDALAIPSDGEEEEEGLLPFMLAGVGEKSDLTLIYNILQMKPDVLVRF